MSAETVVVVLGIIAYSIARQIAGEPLRIKRLLGLPALLTVAGVVDVASSKGRAPTVTDVALIGVGCAINAVIGICQGRLMRLEARDGYLWGQMPKSVLWWWTAKIASGVVLDGIGHVLGAQLATVSAVMLLRLGVNRLAQAAIVAPRALATGIPFAPESDKSGAGRKDEFVSETNRLLTEIRDRATTVVDHARPDTPTYQPAPGPPSTGPIQDNPSGHTTSPPRAFDGSSTSPTSLKRQLAQMLLREINNRINDDPK